VATALDLAVVPGGDEPLGEVAGVLVQRLPDGDDAAIDAAGGRLAAGALGAAVARGASAQDVLREVCGEGFELLADGEVAYRCGCSDARARTAVSALGRDGVLEVLATDKEAVITCEFCRSRYVVDEDALREIARRLGEGEASG
jgi:molecular chaperone Hsp33